ncbi:FkbM family methyltransferase [Serratia proteamaculans]|uniref:FkbM family methyltransferase n=1 Tax=Serratia proteamaculans TaxID=28151 RepID=UPI00217AD270|nr:FkbM family methyltransferase [Serratia proteamaculans]CAI1566068.1 methyltransferase, FkbM family [Serratia proteamaculans]
MSFISYAQNLEDVVLWKALRNVENGFYIDVGANDPIIDSVTRSFYNQGWRGINIEPVRGHFNELVTDRPQDINLNCALNESAGELEIWECDIRGWATLDRDVAKAHEADGHKGEWHNVAVRTLADVCAEFQPENIHFLKVDVEGVELSVLKGNDWNKYRPWVVVVESTFPNTQIETHSEIEGFLVDKNYLFAYADGLNRFYVSTEHKEFLISLKYPPNVFDDYQTYAQFTALNTAESATQKLDDYKRQIAESVLNNNNMANTITAVKENSNELNSLLNVLQQKTKSLDELTLNVGDILGHLNHTRQYDELVQKVSKLSTENERVHIAYDVLSQAYDASQGRIRDLEHEVSLLKNYTEQIYSSTSWRVSAPVRFFGRIKKGKGADDTIQKASLFSRGVRKLIRVFNSNPRLRHYTVRTVKKLGLYSVLRSLYLKVLIGSNPRTTFSTNELLSEKSRSFASFKSSSSLSLDELHSRIKDELKAADDERSQK